MKMTGNYNRKVIQALTTEGLNHKIADSEKRGWQVSGEMRQLLNGHWMCLMVKNKQ
ncbi:hypothetical protein [Metasolibacillus meyeri]|uniref:hypothetical protein n=1 Tax=Metasolibacillus meyeri TaxID=1071052 RepID=UPI00187D5E64|nr:hypothetical protein [Metasolibacillus meyeri]